MSFVDRVESSSYEYPEDHADVDLLGELDELEFPEKAQEAGDLSIKELTRELELRNVKPSGFYAEDCRMLQQLFDEEFQAELANAQKRRDDFLLKKQQEKEKSMMKQRELQERKEEQAAVKHHPKAAFWIQAINSPNCPSDAQLTSITPPLCRAICRSLGDNIRITTLDLAHSTIDLGSGKLLANALCTNKGIKRLELEDCKIGAETLRAFARVLEQNTVLAHLSLENNPLTGPDRDDYSGLGAFAESLQHNSTLIMLNLWRTGLGMRGGSLISKYLDLNTTLLSVGVGCNNLSVAAETTIRQILERNADLKRQKDKEERAIRDKKLEEERIIREKEEEEQKRIEEEEWLIRRKEERALAREQKKLDEQRRIEEQKRLEEEERLRLEEEERLRLEAKKKKKKKGKKKK